MKHFEIYGLHDRKIFSTNIFSCHETMTLSLKKKKNKMEKLKECIKLVRVSLIRQDLDFIYV